MPNNTKNIVIAILITLISGFLFLMVLGLTAEDDQTKETDQKQEQAEDIEKPEGYTIEDGRKDFVRGCMLEGATEEVCTCAFNELIDVYTLEEIAEIGLSGEYDRKFAETVKPCRYSSKIKHR